MLRLYIVRIGIRPPTPFFPLNQSMLLSATPHFLIRAFKRLILTSTNELHHIFHSYKGKNRK